MSRLTREACAALDATDPLARKRDEFALPDGVIYLGGNSLGPLPRRTAPRLAALVSDEWGRDLITSWNRHGWIDLPRTVGDKIARLVGAAHGEMTVADSTSVNLFKLIVAALPLTPGRRTILSERDTFPTDLYIAESAVALIGQGHRLRLVAPDAIDDALGDDVALALLTHVDYRTGRMHDMAAVTAAAHARGALVLWDLAHSAGAVPVDLNGAGADFAVGCGYKYLNGGPGAPSFLYVAARHQGARQPLAGWLGHAAPFAFNGRYRPAPGIARFQCGTPPILSLAALEAGVDGFADVTTAELRAKSLRLTALFIAAAEQACGGLGLSLLSPRDGACRGSQVSLRHAHAYPVMQALIARGIIGDFRAPDILRFGFAPLYVRHVDAWDAAQALGELLRTRAWDRPEHHVRAVVT
jgi:kynureninase